MGRETKINIAAFLRAKLLVILSIGLLGFAMPAAASYLPFNTSVNMNVGIGSASPGTSLDVKGTVRAIGFIAGAGGITLGGVNNTSWPAGGANYWNYSGVGNIGVSTTAAVGVGTTFVGGTGEAAFAVMNGNVGIGTWVPGTVGPFAFGGVGVGVSLDVESANSAGFAVLVNNSAGDGIVAFDSLGNGAALANGNNIGLAVSGIDNAGDVGGLGASSSGTDAALYGQGVTYGLYALGPMNYLQGNVGIGTFNPYGGGLIVTNGNVGIGSLAPGQVLDVQGTIRMKGLTLSGNGAGNGNVLVGNSLGVGTWMAPGTLGVTGGAGSNYWLLNGGAGNVGINTSYAVGIGTTFVGGTGEAALSVMNGNVGIGTWIPRVLLQIGNATTGSGGGAAYGINIGAPGANLYSEFGNNTDLATDATLIYFTANTATLYGSGGELIVEGFGSNTAGSAVSLLAHTNFTATAGDQSGAAVYNIFAPTSGTSTFESFGVQPTINQTGGASGITRGIWVGSTLTAAHDYRAIETDYGNVGIGTISGNLGIGSQWPGQRLDVQGTARMSGFTLTGNGAANGNVLVGNSLGIGTWMAPGTLGVTGGAGSNYWLNTAAAGNVGISTMNTVGIGTTSGNGAGLVVMNGNVGIGTWNPRATLDVEGTLSTISLEGNVGIGTLVATNLLTVNGNIAANGSILANPSGSSTAAPRLFGFSPAFAAGQAAQMQFGDGSNVIQNGNGDRMQMSSYWGIEIHGDYQAATGGFIGGLATDPSLTVFGPATANNNILNLVNKAGTQIYDVVGYTGNVGIGTLNPFGGGLIVIPANSGNVGIGSLVPGQSLDVQGTIRTTGLTLTGNGAASGNVLVGNSVGVGTWMPSSTLGIVGGSGTNYWLLNGGTNVGINTTQAVGIGTSFVGGAGEAALSIMNGNVGIGTWVPKGKLDVEGTLSVVTFGGNVGIGTWLPSAPLDIETNTSNNFIQVSADGSAGYAFSVSPFPLGCGGSMASYGLYMQGTNFCNNESYIYSSAGLIFTVTPTAGTAYLFDYGSSYSDTSSIDAALDNASPTFNPTSGTAVFDSFLTSPVINQTGGASGITRGIFVNSKITAAYDYRAIETDYGNVGIGTISGNLGIGSQWPGQRLDVNGTVRMTGFNIAAGAGSGKVLTSDANGNGTWGTAGAGSNYWLLNGGTNVGINTTQAVGIGTSFVGGTGEATLSVMNGNVGIGTWLPGSLFQVGSATGNSGALLSIINGASTGVQVKNTNIGSLGAFGERTDGQPYIISNWNIGTDSQYNNSYPSLEVGMDSTNNQIVFGRSPAGSSTISYLMTIRGTGNVGIGTTLPVSALAVVGNIGIGTGINSAFVTTTPPSGGMIVQGNIGVGSLYPGQLLDVQGTARMLGLTLTGNGAGNGNVLVGNSVGVGTWMPASTLGVSGGAGTNYWLLNGGSNVGINTTQAVGIGTSFVGGAGEAALSIMNGNVGIGTWKPREQLDVEGTLSTGYFAGNVGIGTWVPNSGLQLNTSFAVYRTSTAASVQSAGQVIIGVTDTTAARTITLATADVAPGRVIIIKDESGGAATHNITVNTQGGQTIDSASSVTISANYGVLRLYSDGTKWFTF